jgi:ATP-dependent Clp protease adaptor protein ClpS
MKNAQLYEMSKKKLEPKKPRGKWVVVMHNDNHNTFEHVVDCIMDICGYSYLQAVQISIIVDRAGLCDVMEDNYDTCVAVHRELLRQGLKVMIEKYAKPTN